MLLLNHQDQRQQGLPVRPTPEAVGWQAREVERGGTHCGFFVQFCS